MNHNDPWTTGKIQPKDESILEAKGGQVLFRLFSGFLILSVVFSTIPTYRFETNRGISELIISAVVQATGFYIVATFIVLVLAVISMKR